MSDNEIRKRIDEYFEKQDLSKLDEFIIKLVGPRCFFNKDAMKSPSDVTLGVKATNYFVKDGNAQIYGILSVVRDVKVSVLCPCHAADGAPVEKLRLTLYDGSDAQMKIDDVLKSGDNVRFKLDFSFQRCSDPISFAICDRNDKRKLHNGFITFMPIQDGHMYIFKSKEEVDKLLAIPDSVWKCD